MRARVGLLFGGRSAEHSISIRSAKSVLGAIDRGRFEPLLIGIDPQGGWRMLSEPQFQRVEHSLDAATGREIGPTALCAAQQGSSTGVDTVVDVVFPILHGAYGEDGTIQGLLEMLDLPYIGAGVLGSAVGMDKDVQKRLLRDAGVPVVPFRVLRHHEWKRESFSLQEAVEALGFPLFVKPANLGSSVGVHKVTRLEDLRPAIEDAFSYDEKILLERGITGREIECSVLGNDAPKASLPGEIVAGAAFYSYEAKYDSASDAQLLIPAPLAAELVSALQNLAVRTFQVLECSGMARVDFFLEVATQQLYVNELNSIPGFTTISMYPKLWEASGLPYPDLISRLIELALERHESRRRLREIGHRR